MCVNKVWLQNRKLNFDSVVISKGLMANKSDKEGSNDIILAVVRLDHFDVLSWLKIQISIEIEPNYARKSWF